MCPLRSRAAQEEGSAERAASAGPVVWVGAAGRAARVGVGVGADPRRRCATAPETVGTWAQLAAMGILVVAGPTRLQVPAEVQGELDMEPPLAGRAEPEVGVGPLGQVPPASELAGHAGRREVPAERRQRFHPSTGCRTTAGTVATGLPVRPGVQRVWEAGTLAVVTRVRRGAMRSSHLTPTP